MDTEALKPSEMDFKLAEQWENASDEERNACMNREMYLDACARVRSWKVVAKVVGAIENGERGGNSSPANANHERDFITVSSDALDAKKELMRPSVYYTVEKIVSSEYNLKPQAVRGKSRSVRNVKARHTICWIMHREFGWSLTQIGMRLKRDHSSVLHGVRKIDNLPAHDEVKIMALGLRNVCIKAITGNE